MRPRGTGETVVIVHGLWMHGVVMQLLARRIEREGYRVAVFSYPSVEMSLQDNARGLEQFCLERQIASTHIVAHSLGGIVALSMLAATTAVQCGRAVLLGPPYAGSFTARRFAKLPGGETLLGRSILDWLQEPHAPVNCELGVIAGTTGFGLGQLVAPDLPEPNDGVVTVAETEVPGMTARILMPVGHSFMLVSSPVARQCVAFLRHGRFEPVET